MIRKTCQFHCSAAPADTLTVEVYSDATVAIRTETLTPSNVVLSTKDIKKLRKLLKKALND